MTAYVDQVARTVTDAMATVPHPRDPDHPVTQVVVALLGHVIDSISVPGEHVLLDALAHAVPIRRCTRDHDGPHRYAYPPAHPDAVALMTGEPAEHVRPGDPLGVATDLLTVDWANGIHCTTAARRP